MRLLQRLFGLRTQRTDTADVRQSLGIDVSGPEFRDLYPSLDDVRERLRRSGLIRPADVDWIAETLQGKIANGSGYRNAATAVVREGPLLAADELKALGLNPKRKVGAKFARAAAIDQIDVAIDGIEWVITVATSTANYLHNLRRYEEAGITEVYLTSANDERTTQVERKYDGKKLGLKQARDFVLAHEEEITRSTFRGNVRF